MVNSEVYKLENELDLKEKILWASSKKTKSFRKEKSGWYQVSQQHTKKGSRGFFKTQGKEVWTKILYPGNLSFKY